MTLSSQYSSYLIVILSAIIAGIYCRDVSYLKQSDVQNNWPTLRTWDTNQKNSTTPWPALGNGYIHKSYNNNPTWVRPNTDQHTITSWHRQGPNRNFDTGSYQGNNRDDIRPSNSHPRIDVTDDDLKHFSENLLNKDVNNAARFVTINVQSKTTSRSNRDEAPLPLISIDKEAFEIPSIKKMLLLHNNYIVESNVNEHYTAQEKQEENNLLDVIINTPIMQYTRNFLIEKGRISQDPKEFRDILREIWFNMYARGGGRIGSSGFEHIFLAEIKNNQVSGLHNWIYFEAEEKNNKVNYLGYMKKIDLGNVKEKGAIIKFHFTFHGVDKPVGSMFIGTSPELEMALYTTCFLLRADKICALSLNGNRFVIRTYTYRYRGKNLIGSAFPEI